jgi:hypothetical protein
MHIPAETMEMAISSFKTNLKTLYKLAEIGESYDEVNKDSISQEKVFEGLFGRDFVDRIMNEAWVEYFLLNQKNVN